MEALTRTQTAMKYLIIFTLIIEVYLLITNVTCAIMKLRYFVPSLLKYDYKAQRHRCVSEFSLTAILVITIIWNALHIFWIPDFNTNFTDTLCRSSFRLPGIYFYLLMNCRVAFAYTRLVMFSCCLNQSYEKTKAGVIAFLLVMLASTIWVQWTIKHQVVDNICLSILSQGLLVVLLLILVIYEITSFALYYIPLRETDGLFGKNLHLEGGVQLLTTTDQHLHVFDEERDPSLSTVHELRSLKGGRSTCQLSQNSTILIRKFHKSVQRNFWAGVITILAGVVEGTLFVLFYGSNSVSESVGISSSVKDWYLQSGLGGFVGEALNLIIYTCMMLCNKHWLRAFIPIFFWPTKSWNE